MDGVGGYVGRMTYDFEQYGCMLHDDAADIELQCRWQPHADWVIRSTGQLHTLSGFSLFMHSMNHYLFEVLQFDPVSHWSKVSATDYEYCFERVYFDMSNLRFQSCHKNGGS
jgi:hypothetical protein